MQERHTTFSGSIPHGILLKQISAVLDNAPKLDGNIDASDIEITGKYTLICK